MTEMKRQIIGMAVTLAVVVLPASAGWGDDPAAGQGTIRRIVGAGQVHPGDRPEMGRPGGTRRFEAFGASNLEINGETDPSAELFSDPSDNALLILSRRLRNAFALTVEDLGLYRIARPEVHIEGEGVMALVPDSVRVSRIGAYTFVDSIATFVAEGLTLRVVPKPPLSGEIAARDLLEHSPEYRYRRDRYVPSEQAIHDLASYGELTEVVVLLAVTSPPCGVWVPRLMKVFQIAGNPVFNIHYLVVDSPDHPALRRYVINVLPAILLFHGDDELGRIEQAPHASLEEEIVSILKGED